MSMHRQVNFEKDELRKGPALLVIKAMNSSKQKWEPRNTHIYTYELNILHSWQPKS